MGGNQFEPPCRVYAYVVWRYVSMKSSIGMRVVLELMGLDRICCMKLGAPVSWIPWGAIKRGDQGGPRGIVRGP